MKKVSLFLVSLITLVTLSIGFSSCGGKTIEDYTLEDYKKSLEKGKLIAGNPSGNMWYTVYFSGGHVTVWAALPRQGHWGGPVLNSVPYEVKEGRFEDTGKKCFYVTFGNTDKLGSYFRYVNAWKVSRLEDGLNSSSYTDMFTISWKKGKPKSGDVLLGKEI